MMNTDFLSEYADLKTVKNMYKIKNRIKNPKTQFAKLTTKNRYAIVSPDRKVR